MVDDGLHCEQLKRYQGKIQNVPFNVSIQLLSLPPRYPGNLVMVTLTMNFENTLLLLFILDILSRCLPVMKMRVRYQRR